MMDSNTRKGIALMNLHYAIEEGLMDLIAESLPISSKLKPINTRAELQDRKLRLEEAKDYLQAVCDAFDGDLCTFARNPEDGCGTLGKCVDEAEKFINQVDSIASEGWFLSGND